jgi:integrase
VRDPEASEPFTNEELASVLTGCAEDISPWVHQSALFLTYAGAHISVLSGGWRAETLWPEGYGKGVARVEYVYSEPIRGDAVRGDHIYWRRPKNEKPIGMPLSRHLTGWLPGFLDKPRPLSTRRYEQVLERVGINVHIQVNPLRFRHTCAVLLYHVMGLDAQSVCRLLGVSPTTLAIYVMKPKWMVAQELKAKGW